MKKGLFSKFNAMPGTKTAWLATGLGLATILGFPLLGIYASAIRPIIDNAASEKVGAAIGFGLIIIFLILSVSALVTCIRAFKKGERSWILWVGFIPTILVSAFWIIILIGEFIFPH
jgi:hypothetical protein